MKKSILFAMAAGALLISTLTLANTAKIVRKNADEPWNVSVHNQRPYYDITTTANAVAAGFPSPVKPGVNDGGIAHGMVTQPTSPANQDIVYTDADYNNYGCIFHFNTVKYPAPIGIVTYASAESISGQSTCKVNSSSKPTNSFHLTVGAYRPPSEG